MKRLPNPSIATIRGRETPPILNRFFAIGLFALFSVATTSVATTIGTGTTSGAPVEQPRWTTSSRLIKLGESIEFQFEAPPGAEAGQLKLYPRYLEQANPGDQFEAGGDLQWLSQLPSERIPLAFAKGRASVTLVPKQTGNYMAEWRIGNEVYYRYFAVIDDSYIVLAFSTFGHLAPDPDFHGTGIPLDYRLPIEQFTPDDPMGAKLLDYNRRFGELVVPLLPDMPGATHDELVSAYGKGLAKARALLPDPLDHRAIRVEMRHNEDPGYPRAFAALGINNHCGLVEANCMPWLGMPEFPYYSSPEDSRRVNQGPGGEIVAQQWDFCGGFHFLGPADWHYAAGEGNFDATVTCLRDGLDELRNLTEMNGRPAIVTPLYGGTDRAWGDNPNPLFYAGDHEAPMLAFARRYQRLVAFELTKSYKLAFTRSIDFTDYFRRHYKETPRTVFSSRSNHLLYDAWWTQGALNHYGVLYTPDRIPWSTRLSTVQKMRQTPISPHIAEALPFKDALSTEFILIEEQKRQVRFERESPNPIWWFDYTRRESTAKGSVLNPTVIPDVQVRRHQNYDPVVGLTLTLAMKTEATFPGYALALWNVPVAYESAPADIDTGGLPFTLVRNTADETHLVVEFDLKPNAIVKIVLRRPRATRWDL